MHLAEIIVLNLYHQKFASKYTKFKKIELPGDTDKSTIALRGFKLFLSIIVGPAKKKKKLVKIYKY